MAINTHLRYYAHRFTPDIAINTHLRDYAQRFTPSVFPTHPLRRYSRSNIRSLFSAYNWASSFESPQYNLDFFLFTVGWAFSRNIHYQANIVLSNPYGEAEERVCVHRLKRNFRLRAWCSRDVWVNSFERRLYCIFHTCRAFRQCVFFRAFWKQCWRRTPHYKQDRCKVSPLYDS